MGCGIYVFVLWALLENPEKEAIPLGLERARAYYAQRPEWTGELEHYGRLFRADFSALPRGEIRSSGYVLDTLEAVIWCLLNTESYESCILTAVNLGSDTDTVGAIAGGLAGVLYGSEGIPAPWLKKLKKREEIIQLCNQFTASL